jgi:hypothetical protein
LFAQKEKLRHYIGKGNFDIKARVARKVVELLQSKEALSKFRIRVDYNATPQGKMLDRSGDIIMTLPSLSFEDSGLATSIHCAILMECLPNAQPIALLTENEAFLQLPFVYTVPVAGKYSKREGRGMGESYTLPWCSIEEDGAERQVGREYSLILERGVAAIRSVFPKPSRNLTASLGLKEADDEATVTRLLDSADVLVGNALDVFIGLKELPGRKSMQIDLLMVWPVLVSEKTPLIVQSSSADPAEAHFLYWWTPVDSTGFGSASGIQVASSIFSSGAGMIVTVVGADKLEDFFGAVEHLFDDIKKRFGKLRLADLYG